MPSGKIHIAGPCSAESREQVLLTAKGLHEVCGELPYIFRAGVWKPRTSPNTFQGAGEEALAWLQEVKSTYNVPVATEIITPEHVEKAIEAGIDYLWIGARTSANPVAVQMLCEQLMANKQKPKAVLIKNPVNADAELWLGNIERVEKTGVHVMAIHRGCNHQPCWKMAHTVRTQRPDIPLLMDPSHMSGDAAQIADLLNKAAELNYDGSMVEVHCHPQEALSDKKQQITPELYRGISLPFAFRSCGIIGSATPPRGTTQTQNNIELNWLRAEIDEADEQIWRTITERMDISRRIGEWKKAHNMAPLQPERFQKILADRQRWAEANGINTAFVEQLMETIHQESIKMQK